MTDLKLGKKDHVEDRRDFKFLDFVKPSVVLPKIPQYFGHEKYLKFPMCGNGPDDTVRPGFGGAGDCVLASADHQTQLWLNQQGVPSPRFLFNGATAIADYSAVTGYVVGDDYTDNGTMIRDALKYRQSTGIIDTKGNRHKIGAYLQLDPGNIDHVLMSMYLFGACEIGIQFPSSAWSQLGKLWKPVAGATIEGGHDIPLVARRSPGWRCVTWGATQYLNLAFFQKYCDEAWAIVSPESLRKTGLTAEGFDLQGLNDALAGL